MPVALNPNVAWMLWDTAARAGCRVAVYERDGATEYTTLAERAGSIGRALETVGTRPGDRVAIFLERGAEAAAAFFGAVAIGAVGINVNETLRPAQVEHVLGHSGARVLLTTARMLARQPRAIETDAALLRIEDTPRAATLNPVARIGPDPAQLIYTSGSTGLPKGVTLSHSNLWAGARAVGHYVGITQDDRIASLLPFSFDYGFNQLLCAVAAGAAIVVERSHVAQHIVATLRGREVTVLPAVPPLWLQLLTVDGFCSAPIPSLRAMTNTGGHLPTAAVRALRRAHPQARLFLMYGLTEAFRSSYLPPEEVDRRPDSIGVAIPGAEILVLRDDGAPAAAGEVGELVHRGPTVALGYWNDREATEKVFRPHPFPPPGTPDAERVVYSGDLVRRDADGFLYYVGRRERLIKVLGYRVSPDEIATVLYASGAVVEAVVAAEADPDAGERIVAYVILAPRASLEDLEAYCRAELPRHLRPSRIEIRADLPRLVSGKHDVAAVRGGS